VTGTPRWLPAALVAAIAAGIGAGVWLVNLLARSG